MVWLTESKAWILNMLGWVRGWQDEQWGAATGLCPPPQPTSLCALGESQPLCGTCAPWPRAWGLTKPEVLPRLGTQEMPQMPCRGRQDEDVCAGPSRAAWSSPAGRLIGCEGTAHGSEHRLFQAHFNPERACAKVIASPVLCIFQLQS